MVTVGSSDLRYCSACASTSSACSRGRGDSQRRGGRGEMRMRAAFRPSGLPGQLRRLARARSGRARCELPASAVGPALPPARHAAQGAQPARTSTGDGTGHTTRSRTHLQVLAVDLLPLHEQVGAPVQHLDVLLHQVLGAPVRAVHNVLHRWGVAGRVGLGVGGHEWVRGRARLCARARAAGSRAGAGRRRGARHWELWDAVPA